MKAATVRSSSSTILMWIGAIVILFAAFTGLYALVPLVSGEVLPGLAFLVTGAVIAVVGLGLVVAGFRSSARVDAQGISWSTGLSGRTFVPWEQVVRVLVPGRSDRGSAVALQLHDGRVVEVTPLRKTSAAETTKLSPWYLRAGATLTSAHQYWRSAQGR